jgi:hypothetical protein
VDQGLKEIVRNMDMILHMINIVVVNWVLPLRAVSLKNMEVMDNVLIVFNTMGQLLKFVVVEEIRIAAATPIGLDVRV